MANLVVEVVVGRRRTFGRVGTVFSNDRRHSVRVLIGQLLRGTLRLLAH